MAEIRVSATDFRVHLKDLANHVATSGDSVVMERHGQRMGVLVSWEDYQLLLRHKPGKNPKAAPPERVQNAAPEQIGRTFSSATQAPASDDARRVVDWRGSKGIVLWALDDELPGSDPPPSNSRRAVV